MKVNDKIIILTLFYFYLQHSFFFFLSLSKSSFPNFLFPDFLFASEEGCPELYFL